MSANSDESAEIFTRWDQSDEGETVPLKTDLKMKPPICSVTNRGFQILLQR